jgi:hypothetical protein
MPHRRAILALLLTFAVSPAFATAEHKYAKGEFAIILKGKAPNGKLSIAAHGEGDAGSENFRLSLMAEPGHRKLMTLDNVNDDNILDSARMPSTRRGRRIPAPSRCRSAASATSSH